MATMQWASKVGSREKKGEGSAWTLCSGLPKKGEGRRKEKVVRGWCAWARPRGGFATRPLSREKGSRENAQDTCLGHEIREYIVGEIY